MTREEAIIRLQDVKDGYTEEAINIIIEAIKQTTWIPISERLPKTDKWRTTFNVTVTTGGVMSMEWENTTVRGKPVSRWIWQNRIAPWDVVAWRPLPQPYKAEGEE